MIDPDIARFVTDSDRFDPPGGPERSLADQRRSYEAYASAFAVRRPPDVSSGDGELVRAGRTIRLRLYRPSHTAMAGTVIYAHGGGFVLGSLDSHDGIVARVADAVDAPVVAVDYRLAPEHPHPAALDDVLAVAAAVRDGQSPWPSLPRRFALMGDSAGGTLACMAALRLGRGGAEGLRALALVYPPLGFEPAEPGRTRWAEAPMLTLADLRRYRSALLGQGVRSSPFPLDGPDLSGLPPAVLLPAEIDPLRDDCTVLADRLGALGIDVMLLPGTGLVHGALRALDRAAAVAEPFGRMCAFLSRHMEA